MHNKGGRQGGKYDGAMEVGSPEEIESQNKNKRAD